jgi:hypothetical protein
MRVANEPAGVSGFQNIQMHLDVDLQNSGVTLGALVQLIFLRHHL